MASVEDAIFARAAGFAGLTALIGTAPTRLYPALAPQQTATPYVVYQMVSNAREHAMGSDPGVAHPRVQFSVYDTTLSGAKDVTLQVIACFSRWRGTVSGIEVLDTFVDNEGDLGFDNESALYQRFVDVLLAHRE